jgi:protein O-GlcNAc transferase
LECHDKAIEFAPNFAEAWNNRGIALYELKRFEEALASYEKAITLKSDYVEAFNNHGNALKELKRFNEALASYDKAIALWPDYAEAVGNRGIIFYELRQYNEALAYFEKAIALKSNDAEIYNNRGNVLIKLGRFREAIADFDRSQTLKSDQPFLAGLRFHAKMRTCDWNSFDNDVSYLTSKIEAGICSAEPFILLSAPAEPALHRKCAELYVADKCSVSPPFWQGERYSHEKIRVAYVSADLREHAVAMLAAGLFECHDKSRFETIALSLGPETKDRLRERLTASFDLFFHVQ